MSKARGASRMRNIKRAGIHKLDAQTGQIKKRPYPNKANGKRKKSHLFVTPMMYVENERGETVKVPLTRTVGYTRRVFPDKNGQYPIDARTEFMHISGNPASDNAHLREVKVITDIKEVSAKSYRVRLDTKMKY